jgi:prepilin peptidase CpaA
MLTTYIHYGLLIALAIGLLIAAFTDIRERRIANWLNLAIVIAAPAFWWASGMSLWPDIAYQFGFALAALAVLLLLYALGAMGGGDLKLLTALALWIKPEWFMPFLIIMAAVGGGVTIIVFIKHVIQGTKERPVVPYGVAIACGGLWVLAYRMMPAVGMSL